VPIISERFVSTLGIKTGLFLDSSRSIIEERERFAIVYTPQNPGYFLGNFLLFERAPQAEDLLTWPRLFDEAFMHDARVKHAAFQWDAREGCGASNAFVAQGYTLEERVVLVANKVKRFEVPSGLRLREFTGDSDWQQQFTMQMNDAPAVYDPEAYYVFKELQIAHQRKIAQELGVWLGIFDGSRLAGSCGIFPAGHSLARFQDVHVNVPYRNRGVARALVAAAAQLAFDRFASESVVIAADASGFARRIYEKAGFTPRELEALLWRPRR
jgi:GNAT superfamily N-acetyltransferase